MDQHIENVQRDETMKTTILVGLGLMALTIVEVLLAYRGFGTKLILALLMGLAFAKASLIIAYFMHLRYERRSLVLTLMPAMVFVLAMMIEIFPDSFRLYQMKVQ